MSPDTRPEAGDVLINRLRRPAATYALSVMPGPSQIVCGTYDEALARAMRFAKKKHVDVWVAEPGRLAAAVARHRIAALA